MFDRFHIATGGADADPIRRLCFLMSVLACVACAPLAARGAMAIFNDGVREAYAHYDQTMTAPRPPLRFASGQVVRDCRDYLDRRRASDIDEAVNNRIVAQEYLVCDSVALLRDAEPLGASQYRPESYGQALLQRLDLRGFPSSLRPMIDDSHFTPAALAGGDVRVELHAVTVETADWSYRFEVVADIDAGGGHDWLLWFTDVAKNGNYRGYQALVVRNPAATGPLKARALP